MIRGGIPVAPARPAFLVGFGASFITAVDLARWIRPGVLLDPDPSWSVPRLLLGLFVVAGAGCAGVLAAAVFFLASQCLREIDPLPLPLRRFTIAALAAAAVLLGAAARFAGLSTLPPWLWIDDVSLIEPALALTGSPRDFADAIRPAPYGVARTYGSVGVLYLELYRGALLAFGRTVFGVRFLSAAAGVLSILTALALAHFLLPRGGGTLAALALAGLRWHLILSRWGWNAVVLAPIMDVAVLLLLSSRRRRSIPLALASGAVAGIGAHVYLSAWIGSAALALLAVWPSESDDPRRSRVLRAVIFATGFVCAAAPLFLLREGRATPYFARASDHSLAAEIRYTRSIMPAFAAAADSLASPWFVADPVARNDVPGRKRLPWVLGIFVAIALGRALVKPREETSAYLLTQAGAALAGSVAGGEAGVPNGYRFGYLADAAAVAAATGMLCLVSLFPVSWRRAAAIAVVGAVVITGSLGARDALAGWPERRETFEGFHGQDTLIARAALRWQRYGQVAVSRELGHSSVTIEGIRRYGLSLNGDLPDSAAAKPERSFRIVDPGEAANPRERTVERVRDAWGHQWARVLGSRGRP